MALAREQVNKPVEPQSDPFGWARWAFAALLLGLVSIVTEKARPYLGDVYAHTRALKYTLMVISWATMGAFFYCLWRYARAFIPNKYIADALAVGLPILFVVFYVLIIFGAL